jgi:hypothetical protein
MRRSTLTPTRDQIRIMCMASTSPKSDRALMEKPSIVRGSCHGERPRVGGPCAIEKKTATAVSEFVRPSQTYTRVHSDCAFISYRWQREQSTARPFGMFDS